MRAISIYSAGGTHRTSDRAPTRRDLLAVLNFAIVLSLARLALMMFRPPSDPDYRLALTVFRGSVFTIRTGVAAMDLRGGRLEEREGRPMSLFGADGRMPRRARLMSRQVPRAVSPADG